MHHGCSKGSVTVLLPAHGDVSGSLCAHPPLHIVFPLLQTSCWRASCSSPTCACECLQPTCTACFAALLRALSLGAVACMPWPAALLPTALLRRYTQPCLLTSHRASLHPFLFLAAGPAWTRLPPPPLRSPSTPPGAAASWEMESQGYRFRVMVTCKLVQDHAAHQACPCAALFPALMLPQDHAAHHTFAYVVLCSLHHCFAGPCCAPHLCLRGAVFPAPLLCRTMLRTIPASVPGIHFLSGGCCVFNCLGVFQAA